MPDSTPPEIGLSAEERDGLAGLRNSLLSLHKLLLDMARVDYVRAHGPVGSPGEFLKIVMTDPWFAWLAPLTGLIVRIDEGLAADDLMTADDVRAMREAARALLLPAENGIGFPKHYDDAMQHDPAVVVAHGHVMKHLGKP